jgi:choline dehydrogenase
MDAAYRALEADGLFRIRRWTPADWVATQAAFVETCVAAGYGAVTDHNAPDAMGAGALPFNQDDRVRWGPSLAYLTAAVRARRNLEIRPHTVVRRIEVEGGRAVAVAAVGPDGEDRIVADEVIVAAGAIGTPHLLLVSGIGPADELAAHGITPIADRPGVGRNLRDHPKAWVDWELRDDVTIADLVPGLQTSARYTATGSTDRGNMMLYPNTVISATNAGFTGRPRGAATAAVTTTPTRVAARRFRIEVVDNLELSSGSVRLRSADPTVPPVIDLGFFGDPVDRERLADGIRRAITLGTMRPMSTLLGERTLPGDDDLATTATLDAWLDRNVMTGHHVSSTCRIGRADDPDAVVDATGRVYGIDGLRIVDASIMPDNVRANIHATVLALAEVMAERIRAET